MPTIDTAAAYMERFDVIAQGRGVRLGAGSDGKIDDVEMNRAAPALALQALPDAEFAKVWAVMSHEAKRDYFFLAYPDLMRFAAKPRTASGYQPHYFLKSSVETEDARQALLRVITNPRDLAYFAQAPISWVDRDLSGDDFGFGHMFGTPKDKNADAALRDAARRISGGAVSPTRPTLAPPRP